MKALICFLMLTVAEPCLAASLTVDPAKSVPIFGDISGETSTLVAAAISKLAELEPEVTLVINSPGGSLLAMNQIVDSMEMAKLKGTKFRCLVLQEAASAAFHIFTHCSERFALASSLLLWHPVKVQVREALSPDKARYIASRLTTLEDELLEDVLDRMPIDYEQYMYHYQAETLWTAKQLLAEMPGWMELVDSLQGIPAFWPEQPAPAKQSGVAKPATEFEFVWQRGGTK